MEYPFRHLESDGVWSLVPLEGASAAFRAAKEAHAEAWHVLRHVACARLPASVFERLSTRFEDRVHALQALWETYFPPDAALKLMRFMTAEEDAAARKPTSTIDVETLTERALEEHLELHWSETPFAGWLPLVKWLLAIPHCVALAFVGIAAIACVVAAWFAILFTGRYPRGLFAFVVGTFRWWLRVAAYAVLLTTDRYPPFSLSA